jgi:hypothetical protein
MGVDVRRGPPVPGSVCLLNSDCENPLVCAAGKCHAQCAETRDCADRFPDRSRCVKVDFARICTLPEESARCSQNSGCLPGLICAPDLRCRNECVADMDCARIQKCVERTCADSWEYDPSTNKLNPPPPGDAGASGDGGPG